MPIHYHCIKIETTHHIQTAPCQKLYRSHFLAKMLKEEYLPLHCNEFDFKGPLKDSECNTPNKF